MSKTKKHCCDMMGLVLSRARPGDRLGLMVDTLWSLKTGRCRETTVLRFHKAPRGDKSEFARATLVEINYCPFCGKARCSGKTPGKIADGRRRS